MDHSNVATWRPFTQLKGLHGQAKSQRCIICNANNENSNSEWWRCAKVTGRVERGIWRWAEAKCQVKVANWPISHLHSGSNSSHYLFKPWCAGNAVGWWRALQVRTVLEVVMWCDRCTFEGVLDWPLAMICLPGWLEECAVIWDLLHLLHLLTIVNSTMLWDKCGKIIFSSSYSSRPHPQPHIQKKTKSLWPGGKSTSGSRHRPPDHITQKPPLECRAEK